MKNQNLQLIYHPARTHKFLFLTFFLIFLFLPFSSLFFSFISFTFFLFLLFFSLFSHYHRLWNESDRTDSRIFAYERERGYFASPIFSPFCSLLADILMFKLFPPLFASFVLYPCLSLNPNWHVWGRFLYATCLIQIAAACYCKVSTSIGKSTCVCVYVCVYV